MKKEFVNAQATVNEATENVLDRVAGDIGYANDPAEYVMPIAATIERNAAYAMDDHQRQAEMVLDMLKLAKAYHPDLQCYDTAEAYYNTRAFMLALSRDMLQINYNIDLGIDNMIYSKSPAAFHRATMAIRNECHRFLKSRVFLDYIKEKNVAYLQDGGNFIIQLLSGSFNVSNGKYEFDHTITADGICLDPSMKGWDMIMFLMYT